MDFFLWNVKLKEWIFFLSKSTRRWKTTNIFFNFFWHEQTCWILLFNPIKIQIYHLCSLKMDTKYCQKLPHLSRHYFKTWLSLSGHKSCILANHSCRKKPKKWKAGISVASILWLSRVGNYFKYVPEVELLKLMHQFWKKN